MEKQNIILFVGTLPKRSILGIREYEKEYKKKFRIAVLRNSKKISLDPIYYESADIILSCDLSSTKAIETTLLPYQKDIIALTCDGDDNVPLLQKVIPHVPYVRTPTVESLKWTIDKILMRERFNLFDKTIGPATMVIENTTKKTLGDVKKNIGYPLVAKPTNLGASILVNVCFHEGELKKIFKIIKSRSCALQQKNGREERSSVLVEQFMEGDMYSIDAYINSKGKIYFCPPVHVKTGRSVGFDDLFGYQRITPTSLRKESVEKMEEIATKAVHALGLRSTSAHIECIKTEKGWKIVEIGPRIGGFRHIMYKKSYNINHVMNDVLIHIPQKPIIPRKVLGHTAVLYFYAKKEGVIKKISGVKPAQRLKSFYQLKTNKKIGDRCLFAKNGGKSVLIFTLFNKDRSKLLADIRRLEKLISIETK